MKVVAVFMGHGVMVSTIDFGSISRGSSPFVPTINNIRWRDRKRKDNKRNVDG